MSRRNLHSITVSNTRFVGEQIGIPENVFKQEAVGLFQSRNYPLRAYLAQVKYDDSKKPIVAVCIASDSELYETLVPDIASIFRRMFGSHEHLDIILLVANQERQLRQVCCPFFCSNRYDYPDFFLTSSEGYGLHDMRACFKERRFIGSNHPDGYMLCEIRPALIGQSYGLGGRDIHKIVIASRHAGHSIFIIEDWPGYVHVARLANELHDKTFDISMQDIESIGWGEIYESPSAVKP